MNLIKTPEITINQNSLKTEQYKKNQNNKKKVPRSNQIQ
jgi:hypothetical protein